MSRAIDAGVPVYLIDIERSMQLLSRVLAQRGPARPRSRRALRQAIRERFLALPPVVSLAAALEERRLVLTPVNSLLQVFQVERGSRDP
jgi:hypothetical protein